MTTYSESKSTGYYNYLFTDLAGKYKDLILVNKIMHKPCSNKSDEFR